MRPDIVSMPLLFERCRDVLSRSLRPWHYTELTREALRQLGRSELEVDFKRVKEDVREKWADAGRDGVCYTGAPQCMVFLERWVRAPHDQLSMLDGVPHGGVDAVSVALSVQTAIAAGVEALCRAPFMIAKAVTSPERRNEGRYRGLLIQHVISSWFCREWPEFYREPSNHLIWDRPSSDDFNLEVAGRTLRIDVFGDKLNGEYQNPGGGKRAVDMHLAATTDVAHVKWHGVLEGNDYRPGILPLAIKAMSPGRMCFWLNCHKHGVPYEIFREAKEAA